MRASLLVAWTIPLALSCSLMGLDETAATPCLVSPSATTDYGPAHATCAAALGGASLGACEAWVCALRVDDELFCVVGAPDEDGDGVGDAACIPEGDERPRDCDDANAAIAEGRAERCDGLDNDCDGIVDEGLLQASGLRRVMESDGSAERVAFAGVSALLRRGVGGQQALFVRLRSGAPSRVGDFSLYDPVTVADDPGLALAPAGSALVGVFARNLSGCPRTLVAARIAGGAASAAALERGLPDPEGRDCGSDPRRVEPQRAPTVASLGARSLIAWIASASEGGPLRLVGATDAAGLTLSGPALALGEAEDAVALLALPEDDRVLAAIPRGDAIELVAVELSSAGAPTVSAPLASVPARAAELALAAGPAGGPTGERGRAVALAYRRGEGRGARVVLQRLTYARDAGTLTLDEATEVGDTEGQGAPALTWSAAPRGWIVAWTERGVVSRARLLGERAGVAGPAVSLVAEVDFAERPELRFGFSIAAAEQGLTALTHVRAGAATGLHELTLGCVADP